MDLRPVHKVCTATSERGTAGSCPTVYATDEPNVVAIQGYTLSSADVPPGLPEGEAVVTIPMELVEWLRHSEITSA